MTGQASQDGIGMNERALLTGTSILANALFVIHWAQDVALGLDRVGLRSYGGVALSLVWLLAATILRDGRVGKWVQLVFGLLATALPALHLKGTRIGEIARGEGGLAFVLVLFWLGITAGFSAVLAVRGIRRASLSSRP